MAYRNRRGAPKQFVVRRVTGNALAPQLEDGQLVICRQAVEPRTGDVVLVSKDGQESIQRVIRHQGNVLYFVGQQLAEDTGEWLAAKYIVAKIIWPVLA
jgi:phage repressor protein C with HTH and peptisase S24 domain